MNPLLRVSTVGLMFLVSDPVYAATPRMQEFKIAGGQAVTCPVTETGPLPAESGPYKMVTAGFALGPDPTGKHLALIFGFDVNVNPKGKPTRVLIEDVSGDVASTMVDDSNPKVEKKNWSANAKPILISETSTPWIFENTSTIKVFKVTVSAKDTPDVVLYQPAFYPAQMKAAIAAFAKKKG
jgi:hypothetical protein